MAAPPPLPHNLPLVGRFPVNYSALGASLSSGGPASRTLTVPVAGESHMARYGPIMRVQRSGPTCDVTFFDLRSAGAAFADHSSFGAVFSNTESNDVVQLDLPGVSGRLNLDALRQYLLEFGSRFGELLSVSFENDRAFLRFYDLRGARECLEYMQKTDQLLGASVRARLNSVKGCLPGATTVTELRGDLATLIDGNVGAAHNAWRDKAPETVVRVTSGSVTNVTIATEGELFTGYHVPHKDWISPSVLKTAAFLRDLR